MDVAHHALIGGAGYLVGVSADRPLVGLAFLAGNVLPDLDVAFMAGGRRFYLKHHQGPTHSLLLAPLYATGICLLLCYLVGLGWSWGCFVGACLGLLLHVVLDWTNTYGIGLFWPLSSRRYCLPRPLVPSPTIENYRSLSFLRGLLAEVALFGSTCLTMVLLGSVL